jgi:hypothetical protein
LKKKLDTTCSEPKKLKRSFSDLEQIQKAIFALLKAEAASFRNVDGNDSDMFTYGNLKNLLSKIILPKNYVELLKEKYKSFMSKNVSKATEQMREDLIVSLKENIYDFETWKSKLYQYVKISALTFKNKFGFFVIFINLEFFKVLFYLLFKSKVFIVRKGPLNQYLMKCKNLF